MTKLPGLSIPLPPSVNTAYFYSNRGKHVQMFYGKAAKDWFEIATPLLQIWMGQNKIKPISDYTYLDMHIYLRRKNSDSHNYFKVLFDGFEKAGLFTDDRYIMPRVQEIDIDSKNPRIECTFSSPYDHKTTSETPKV